LHRAHGLDDLRPHDGVLGRDVGPDAVVHAQDLVVEVHDVDTRCEIRKLSQIPAQRGLARPGRPEHEQLHADGR
jgi:hypothetical protein